MKGTLANQRLFSQIWFMISHLRAKNLRFCQMACPQPGSSYTTRGAPHAPDTSCNSWATATASTWICSLSCATSGSWRKMKVLQGLGWKSKKTGSLPPVAPYSTAAMNRGFRLLLKCGIWDWVSPHSAQPSYLYQHCPRRQGMALTPTKSSTYLKYLRLSLSFSYPSVQSL